MSVCRYARCGGFCNRLYESTTVYCRQIRRIEYRTVTSNDYHSFAPSVGMFGICSEKKTVLRTGYGMSYSDTAQLHHGRWRYRNGSRRQLDLGWLGTDDASDLRNLANFSLPITLASGTPSTAPFRSQPPIELWESRRTARWAYPRTGTSRSSGKSSGTPLFSSLWSNWGTKLWSNVDLMRSIGRSQSIFKPCLRRSTGAQRRRIPLLDTFNGVSLSGGCRGRH